MDGMTRTEIDKIERRDMALGQGPLRPRDAATLILLDLCGDGISVLMGRRNAGHAFMPGKFVFPGGRTDPEDSRVAVVDAFDPLEAAKLTASTRIGASRARAIGLSAIRETYEEAGLMIGHRRPFKTSAASWQAFAKHSVAPSLSALRYVARAITPPGRTRRFDTHFFAAWRESVAVQLPEGGPHNELQELVWLPLAEAKKADIPVITRTILDELEQRLALDPLLRPGGGPVPFYRMVRNHFTRDLI